MATDTVNVLLTTFGGLSLPRTLSLPLSAELPISSFADLIANRLPDSAERLTLSTTSNKVLDWSSTAPLSSLCGDKNTGLLPLRLSACLLGGKGGFGSQLRAAGGRMSSRKKKQSQEQIHGSSRNLDGRRLRTVTEAKNLAEYLAMKPDMDKKQREERRQRWEAVVEAAERKEDEIKKCKGNARLDGEWVSAKEEAEGKTRDAVLAAMRADLLEKENKRTGSESSVDVEDSDEAGPSGSGSSEEETIPTKTAQPKTFFGWDDDEDMSDEDEEADADAAEEGETYAGKGKGKA